ncbi:MAG: enoyl-CoA hydratase/isomerase family protein [Pseudomonadales bacterium]|nr:enoyl-CoA hydratase/isomerase family protein [Pseudomonadales bacterium]
MSEVLKTRVEDGVCILTLNRPEQLNAFNDDLYDAVTDGLRRAATDDAVSVVVITGEGRAFSAGQDLAELENPRQHDDPQAHGFPLFIATVESFPKPLIAAINGLGVGIGLTLLPHCDLVLMADDARLRAPFVSLGVTVEAGNSYLLPATVGWQAASHLLYTASWIDAERAVEIGLAFRTVPASTLMEETLAMAKEIAAMPLDSLVGTKQLLLDSRLDFIRAARSRENVTFASLRGRPANRAAIEAFKKKS